jgi:hypothetical protein
VLPGDYLVDLGVNANWWGAWHFVAQPDSDIALPYRTYGDWQIGLDFEKPSEWAR